MSRRGGRRDRTAAVKGRRGSSGTSAESDLLTLPVRRWSRGQSPAWTFSNDAATLDDLSDRINISRIK
jgi:hypothetical protein